MLTVNGASVYPSTTREGCALTMSATGQSRDQLTLSVILADNRSSDVLYSKQSAFTLAGLELGLRSDRGPGGRAVLADGFGGTQTVGSAAGVGPGDLLQGRRQPGAGLQPPPPAATTPTPPPAPRPSA